MNPKYFIVILLLNFACINKQASEKNSLNLNVKTKKTHKPLKFNSGIHAIFQDSKGQYWFGSHGEGICRFDGNSYEYFTTRNGLADNHVLSIQEDHKGKIWVGTLHGVSSYNGEGFSNHKEEKFKTVNIKWSNDKNDLWFNAGTREGVYRYDGIKLEYLPFPITTGSQNGNVYSLTSASRGKNDMIWFGTFAGVIGFNGIDFTTINDETLTYENQEDNVHVRSIFEDSKGRLWIGNNGIGVLMKEGEEIVNFSKKNGKLIPLNIFEANTLNKQFLLNTGLQSVFAISEDSYGNIWFGDRDTGAWKFDGKSLKNFVIDAKLESQMVWTIYEDQYKNLLFGMAFGSVYKFNGKSFEKFI